MFRYTEKVSDTEHLNQFYTYISSWG